MKEMRCPLEVRKMWMETDITENCDKDRKKAKWTDVEMK